MIRQYKNYKSFIDNVVKLLQGRKVRYISAKTGNAYNTVEEAVKDNTRYVKDPNYRYLIKEQKVRKPKEYNIPFIKDKKVILTNAGLASGAVLSTNMLDTIAKHAEAAGLPINIAIALAAKESTLGNPTFDKSIYKILNPQRRKIYEWFKNGQHINNGNDIPERELINWTRDELGPYGLTMSYLDTKRKTQELYNAALEASEKYDDGRVKDYEDTYADNNVLFNGFKFYKEHPDLYNPGLPNYLELVNQRAKEIWQSPEIQEWYKQYLTNKKIKSLKQGGKMNVIEQFKQGSGIHIKKKNRGKFTSYCGGKVTDECIRKAKASGNPTLVKRATFADNARHFKHRFGGSIVEAFKKWKHLKGGTINGGSLEEITVVPTRLSLSTYYPIIGKDYRYTGHSSLNARSPEYTVDTSDGFTTVPAKHARINKRSSDVGYNFITNNCADATRCALESITGKKMNPYFFTTPGDVLDFFKENFDDVRKVKSKDSGKEVYYTNITPKQLEMIREQLLELMLKNRKERHKELLANARKWKHKKGGILLFLLQGNKIDWAGIIGNFASQALLTYALNKLILAKADLLKEANNALKLSPMEYVSKYFLEIMDEENRRNEAIKAISGTTVNSSDVVGKFFAHQRGKLEAFAHNKEIDNLNKMIDAEAEGLKSQGWMNLFSNGLLSGIGMLANNIGKSNNNVPPSSTITTSSNILPKLTTNTWTSNTTLNTTLGQYSTPLTDPNKFWNK